MKRYKRIFVVVLDSLGIGGMDDSPAFGDYGVDTLGHIAEQAESLYIPNLQKLGLANLHSLKGTALYALKEAGMDVISVGKMKDIFDGEGITESYKSRSSVHGMEQTIGLADKDFTGLCFVNLVDFDALWVHRRDVNGYAKELEMPEGTIGTSVLGRLGQEN